MSLRQGHQKRARLAAEEKRRAAEAAERERRLPSREEREAQFAQRRRAWLEAASSSSAPSAPPRRPGSLVQALTGALALAALAGHDPKGRR